MGLLKVYSRVHGQHSTIYAQSVRSALCAKLYPHDASDNITVDMEWCFRIVYDSDENEAIFWRKNTKQLRCLLANSPFESTVALESHLKCDGTNETLVEIGPRPAMTTPFSTNATAVLRAAGVLGVRRVECSRRYLICVNYAVNSDKPVGIIPRDVVLFGDRMTECIYEENLVDREFMPIDLKNSTQTAINVLDLRDGERNLREANASLALGFDESDIRFYLRLFRDGMRRNPTDVELFDLAQSNSEHSRHWFFKGRLVVDGVPRDKSLFDTIQATQRYSNLNNVIAFSDNSSAIKGATIRVLVASQPDAFAELVRRDATRHIVYTAETHNFPTGVCPFPGAATGVGGRIRDVHATGRGAHEIAGVAGYSVGNLNLPDFRQPWELADWSYPTLALASPAKILLEASDGASDYGNKFGEPLICGFTRTFGMLLPARNAESSTNSSSMERVEYVKPIMFSGGIGAIDEPFLRKVPCQAGQLVAKIGGPVYRIGVGGGAASSCVIQGARDNSIDFGAVQRGDPEMEQKLRRVIRACVECGDENPILSIHDQGAGGNGNVLKEIVDGANGGAEIFADAFELGDHSVTVGELWGAEYQESDAILLEPSLRAKIERIARRERCAVAVVGAVSGDRRVVLRDFGCANGDEKSGTLGNSSRNPVDFDLRLIAEREPKTFQLDSLNAMPCAPLELPAKLTVLEALRRVLALPAVGSKRFLTTKVDRSVTGLVAQQQCVGILQTPLADVAVTALSFWDTAGGAVACGEQPIKGLVRAEVGARMAVAEALTNLVFAPITELRDVKCSGNWMWPALLPGEGARIVRACDAMCATMRELGVAIDGGKDSLSMAAQVEPPAGDDGAPKIVKAPGTLVVSAYAMCVDIRRVVTPNFKPYLAKATAILHVGMSRNSRLADATRLGGSALAQCFAQIGGPYAADLDDASHFARVFALVQRWIRARLILAGHDVSDGGLIGALLECAFAGNCGFECQFDAPPACDGAACSADDSQRALKALFAEECGLILEVDADFVGQLVGEAAEHGVNSLQRIGRTLSVYGAKAMAKIRVNNVAVLDAKIVDLREMWEETSDRMESVRISPKCVRQQAQWRRECTRAFTNYRVPFAYGNAFTKVQRPFRELPRVAILREEGSNGDREMAAAFSSAGFGVFDLAMSDLTTNTTGRPLAAFRGVAFVGGFSYADVFGSARGWAASIHFNAAVSRHFDAFRRRADTFSLGVCNGCQLMALLGFLNPNDSLNSLESETSESEFTTDVFLDENESGRFYSGFNAVRVEPRNVSILLDGMADAVLGVWCSHGEGRFTYRTPQVLGTLTDRGLVALRYCDDDGRPTERYPHNPNGSQHGVAGLCSADGRHLAMMPHSERSFLRWQCAQPMDDQSEEAADRIADEMQGPKELKNMEGNPSFSPWIRLFQNAYAWCAENGRD